MPPGGCIIGLDPNSDSFVETLPDENTILRKRDTLVIIEK
jgi:hypothetical protein